MARKSHDDGGGGQEWMNTYSDLVTLLMTFFVLLFSMSSVDAEKWETFVKALAKDNANTSQIVINRPEDEGGDSPLTNNGDANQLAEGINPTDEPTPLPTDFDDLYAFLQKYVEENNLGAAIEISKSGDNVVYIRFRNNIFFMPDKSDLLPEGMEVLSYLGDCLAAVQDQIHLVIHLDPVVTSDPKAQALQEQVRQRVQALYPQGAIHDFRVVWGVTHSNVLFDVAVPFSLGDSDQDIKEKLAREIAALDPSYRAVLAVDREGVVNELES